MHPSFPHEDPWERLRKFRDGFKNTKLQMFSADRTFWDIVHTQMMW